MECATVSFTGGGLKFWLEAYSTTTQDTVSFTPKVSATNVCAAIVPKGTGAITAAIPDGTVTGGNARGNYATDWQKLRGAADNVASGAYSTISGGVYNIASGEGSTVGGGGDIFSPVRGNFARAIFSTISGGRWHEITSGCDNATIGGGVNNVISGTSNDAPTIAGGSGNRITNAIEGAFAAGKNNSVTFRGVAIGVSNTVNGLDCPVAFGQQNTASQWGASVGGGKTNTASGQYSSIGGGQTNTASATHSFVGGGIYNIASGDRSVIVGGGSTSVVGDGNRATGTLSFVGGGIKNTASGLASVVVGGGISTGGNLASGNYSFVGSGTTLTASGLNSVVVGGNNNQTAGNMSVICGGETNRINKPEVNSGNWCFLGAGQYNDITGPYSNHSVLVGGFDNTVGNGYGMALVGGRSNSVNGSYAFIGGGELNAIGSYPTHAAIPGGKSNSITANGNYATIGGGQSNTASQSHSVVSGGQSNTASAIASTVVGGYNATASLYGQVAHGAGQFSTAGDAQAHELIWRRAITGTTQTELFLDGAAARAILPATNTVWKGIINIAAVCTNAGGGITVVGDVAAIDYTVTVKRIAGNTVLVAAANNISALDSDPSMATSVFTIAADNTNEALTISYTAPATADATTVIRVVATFRGLQIQY